MFANNTWARPTILPARLQTLAAGALLAAATHAAGQAPHRLPRVGFCSPGIPEASLVNYEHPIPQALLANMRERGWHHEKNYRLMFRTAVGRPGGMPACIDSLVAEPVDVIMVPGAARVASERAKAADLPPQQIEEYEVGVNLAVARRLGIEVSPSFLLRADRVYEDETGKADGRLRPRY